MPLRPPTEQLVPYHVLSIQGPPGSGKSRLAAKAARVHKKQAILATEGGWRRAIKDLPNWEQKFLAETYLMLVDLSADVAFRQADEKEAKDKADELAEQQANKIRKEVWRPLMKDAMAAFADPQVGSVVYDLADEFREIIRLAYLGKLEKNAQLAYGPVNAEWKNLFRLPLRHKKTLISLHTVKQKYRTAVDQNGREKSVEVAGVFERKADPHIDYLIESFIACHSVSKGQQSPSGQVATETEFWVQILNAKKNPMANGTIMPQPETWAELMMYLDPDTPVEAWEEEGV